MMHKKWTQFFVLVLALVTVSPALAQAKGYVGAIGGISVPDADDTSSRLAFGVVGGARLDGEFGLGGYFLTSSNEEDVNGVDVDFNYSLFGFEASFHFEGVADGAFVGVRVGMTKVEVGTTVEVSPIHYGAVFGYDYFTNDNFSVGIEGSWLSVEEDTDNNVTVDSFGMINFMAAAKFWF